MASEKKTEVKIRRSAKFLPFMITGAVLGVVVALIISLAIPEQQRTAQPIITYLVAFLGGIGFFIGLIAALILERIFIARAKAALATKLEG
jgi:H+/Cl- antiporter ClcA